MREDLLHYVWRYRKFGANGLQTTQGQPVDIISPGSPNTLAGPDFFNARIRIDGQAWAGNVEIHVKASDWYVHHHETDPAYHNVILHVVWEDDIAIFRRDGSQIPALELRKLIPIAILESYRALLDRRPVAFVNCEKDLASVSGFLWDNWLERLYLERLERKGIQITELLARTGNDWERVLFILLLKNFGSKVNGDAFYRLALSIDFSLVRKCLGNPFRLEALLMGQCGLLRTPKDAYQTELATEFNYLRHAYDLDATAVPVPAFFKLRPENFPTIRLSQFAALYAGTPNLFAHLMEGAALESLHERFEVVASDYWSEHYTFGKRSAARPKRLTRNFVDLILINTVFPLKFCYDQKRGHVSDTPVMAMASGVAPERNGIVSGYTQCGILVRNALHTQALLQLHEAYCTRNKCLQCAVGHSLLG